MNLTVYILHSQSKGRYYAGFTTDLDARITKHCTGQNKSTSFVNDWQVVWIQIVSDSLLARQLEKSIKSRGIGRFLAEQSVSTF